MTGPPAPEDVAGLGMAGAGAPARVVEEMAGP